MYTCIILALCSLHSGTPMSLHCYQEQMESFLKFPPKQTRDTWSCGNSEPQVRDVVQYSNFPGIHGAKLRETKAKVNIPST